MFMTKDFDIMSEQLLEQQTSVEEQPVSVGWGKAETQFRGQAGKLQQATVPSVSGTSLFCAPLDLIPPSGSVAHRDDGRTRVSWRGDGEFVAVSSVSPYSKTRTIRVFSRLGALQSASEITSALGQSLSWRPSGNWIARSRCERVSTRFSITQHATLAPAPGRHFLREKRAQARRVYSGIQLSRDARAGLSVAPLSVA
jgi:elongator complex protein 1